MKTVLLGEVASVFNGKTPGKTDQRSSGHPVLKIRDIDSRGNFVGSFGSFVDAEFAEKHRGRWAELGDTLILNAAHQASHVGSKLALVRPDSAGSLLTGEWLAVRPSAAVDSSYLHHWLSSARTKRVLKDLVKGIHLYPRDVTELRIDLPPLDEQRRIAAILDRADELRRMNLRGVEQLGGLVQSLFADRFGHPEELLIRWPTVKLGDELQFLTSGSRGWAKYYSSSGDVFLRIQNVKRDALDMDDLAYVQAPDTAEAKRTLTQPGDVLLSITADLGRTAVVPKSLGRAHINQHLALLRCSSSVIPRYLSVYLTSPLGQRQLLGRNRQAVKAGLNFDDIRSLQLPLPPIDQQESFAAACSRIDELRADASVAAASLDSLFASLQSRAFSGQL